MNGELITTENGQKMSKTVIGTTIILTAYTEPQENNIEPSNDPLDKEKVAMEEAIIDLDTRVTGLESKLNGGN